MMEGFAPVEWADWSFGSRRPFIICPGCGRRVSRAFITTDLRADNLGCLLCHRCARVRYRSQDASLQQRLTEQIDAIRIRLGGSPVNGGTIPPKPPRMHWRTYDRLTGELVELEAALRELEELRRRIVEQQIYAARLRALRQLAPHYEHLARLESRIRWD